MLAFTKYHGTGNDFILIDDREQNFPAENYPLVKKLCDRHFGIGADGLILIRSHETLGFEMVYYNSDGYPGSMCGNGGRCSLHFAQSLGLCDKSDIHFMASDGEHFGYFDEEGLIHLQLQDVNEIQRLDGGYYLHTGSPHFVLYVADVLRFDVYKNGKEIRNNARFREKGTNVNFVQEYDAKHVRLRTYERGVEDETLSCGTGTVATALVHLLRQNANGKNRLRLDVQGGVLFVETEIENQKFKNNFLIGPAEAVFSGLIELEKINP